MILTIAKMIAGHFHHRTAHIGHPLGVSVPLCLCGESSTGRRSWRAARSASGSNRGTVRCARRPAIAGFRDTRRLFRAKPFIELHLRLPAQLAARLLAVDGVAQVVSRTVGHELDKLFGSPERAQNQLGYFDDCASRSRRRCCRPRLRARAAARHRARCNDRSRGSSRAH